MGFLTAGEPLSWEEVEGVTPTIKRKGVAQLLNLLRTHASRRDEESSLRWGDEVEFTLLAVNSNSAQLYVGASSTLAALEARPTPGSGWHPEFGDFMVESYPQPAFPLAADSLAAIETNMAGRRRQVQEVLSAAGSGLFVSAVTVYPRFGVGGFATRDPATHAPLSPPGLSAARSSFVPAEIYTPHPRFPTLVRHVRARRGAKTQIAVPVFRDACTDARLWPAGAPALSAAEARADRRALAALSATTADPIRGHIYMDDFSFGMGQSCVQMTYGTRDMHEARWLYDQLGAFAPLLLALTASTPYHRGLLADGDTRWPTLEQAVDCRKAEEMQRLPKSRYSAFSLYLSPAAAAGGLNDAPAPGDAAVFAALREAGYDEALAAHYAHLFVRDPLVIFGDRVDLDDRAETDHFENLQSTNWNSVRFKPPPAQAPGGIGWRVELRTAEAQLSDFENAATAGFATVLVVALLEGYRAATAAVSGAAGAASAAPAAAGGCFNFYQPMSLNDCNMSRAFQRNAVTTALFHWRGRERSLLDILTDPSDGLLPFCSAYMRRERLAGRCSAHAAARWEQFAQLFLLRARGELMTDAAFLRRFVREHPAYRGDSVVSRAICRDLSALAVNVGFGVWAPEALFGALGCHVRRAAAGAAAAGAGRPTLLGDLLFSQQLAAQARFTFCDPCSSAPPSPWAAARPRKASAPAAGTPTSAASTADEDEPAAAGAVAAGPGAPGAAAGLASLGRPNRFHVIYASAAPALPCCSSC